MNRRNFLHAGSLTGLSLMTAKLSGWAATPQDQMEEITIAQLQEKMKNGQATAVSITRYYLNRIRAIDQQGPRLNSVIEINPEALAIAAKMDANGNRAR